ncbi:MAG TPA: hypothetical protein VGI85_03185 [Chthoniobacterales bacterium]
MKDPAEMPVIGANHKRTISISLHLVDQRLCEWEQRLEGHLEKGVMYQLQDDIAPAQRKELRRRIAETRERLDSLRKKLGLEPARPSLARMIVGQATILWEMLAELNSSGLRGYGTVPASLAKTIDPAGEALVEELSGIVRLMSQDEP